MRWSVESALLAQQNAKLHNQLFQLFLCDIRLVGLQHHNEIILGSMFEYVTKLLLELWLAANGFSTGSVGLRWFPAAWLRVIHAASA